MTGFLLRKYESIRKLLTFSYVDGSMAKTGWEGLDMLIVANSLRQLHFGMLMDVYRGSNQDNGADNWPELPEGQQILNAENGFYQYLDQVFFAAPGSQYYLWSVNGRYVSALRLEPYRDGLLLEALETMPEFRRQGYGEKLMIAVLESLEEKTVYSHVHKKNIPSLKIHEKCGFRRILEYAVYVDGSVNDRCCTLIHKK